MTTIWPLRRGFVKDQNNPPPKCPNAHLPQDVIVATQCEAQQVRVGVVDTAYPLHHTSHGMNNWPAHRRHPPGAELHAGCAEDLRRKLDGGAALPGGVLLALGALCARLICCRTRRTPRCPKSTCPSGK